VSQFAMTIYSLVSWRKRPWTCGRDSRYRLHQSVDCTFYTHAI